MPSGRTLCRVVGAVLWLGASSPAVAAPAPPQFWDSPEDAAPAVRGGMNKRLSDLHYVVGNEYALHAFHDDVKDLGGGYVGVGSDQAYLLIGWQKPELAWLIDYDPTVKEIHRIYAALFAAAPTPARFYRLFFASHTDAALAALEATHGPDEARALGRLYLKHRRLIRLRLWHVRARLKEAETPSYLTDQEIYDGIRSRVLQRRIRPMVVDSDRELGPGRGR